MLVAEPTQACASQRYFCLDMLEARFASAPPVQTSDAILLEVWHSGGILQTGVPVQPGTSMLLSPSKRSVRGRVLSCLQDDYGYVIEFAVDSEDGWFPAYQPPYLLPNEP